MLCLSLACGRQRLHSLLRSNASFLRSPVRRESLRPPPDGCRFEKRIRDLECSLREERRALREADALCRRRALQEAEARYRELEEHYQRLLSGSSDKTGAV